MSKPFATVNVLGLDFINTTNQAFLEQLKKDCQTKNNRFIVTANPEIVLAAKNDPHYALALKTADYITPDGIGIIKGAKILKTPLPERITGFDTLCALLEFASQTKKKIFLLGAKPNVIKQAVENVATNYPGAIICGYHDGYFKDEQAVVNQIKNANPDMVFVALGFPKQEYFIKDHRQVAPALWMGVGGSFDVLAGIAKRAPQFWINLHLEWFYRLLKEPSRFIRMLALPKYLLLVYRKRFLNK